MFEQTDIRRVVSGDGRDLLIQGDGSVPRQELAERAGTVQVVYMDPPFMTGEKFTLRRRFGLKGWRTGTPSPSYCGYEDRYEDRDAYLKMLRGLIENAWMLLTQDGMLCLHLDWRASHLGRLLCDEIFGPERFVNEIVWAYESGGRTKRCFSRKHDTILLYARGKGYRFDITRVPQARGEVRRNHMRRDVDEQGRAYSAIRVGGKEYRYYDDEPVYPGDVWTDISHLQQRDPERVGYPTQKPVKLLERVLKPLVKPGDIVADLCCGSGTALVEAQALGARLLGMDMSQEALQVTRSRLRCDGMTLLLEPVRDDVPLVGTCVPDRGAITLEAFPAAHPSFP